MAMFVSMSKYNQVMVLTLFQELYAREWFNVIMNEHGLLRDGNGNAIVLTESTIDSKHKTMDAVELMGRFIGFDQILSNKDKIDYIDNSSLSMDEKQILKEKFDCTNENDIILPSHSEMKNMNVSIKFSNIQKVIAMIAYSYKALWVQMVKGTYGIWLRKDGSQIELSEKMAAFKLSEMKRWIKILKYLGSSESDIFSEDEKIEKLRSFDLDDEDFKDAIEKFV